MVARSSHDSALNLGTPASAERGVARTVLTAGTRLDAEVIGEVVVLQGVFHGTVRGHSICVDPSGEVDASLVCSVAEILGRFQGTIEAESLSFGPAAVAHGVFEADRLMIADGAVVNGSFNAEGASAASTLASSEPRPGPMREALGRSEARTVLTSEA